MSPPAADPFASHFRETPTHVYFLRGPLSQWRPSRFRAALTPEGPELEFNCAEQYMMAGKATLFRDTATLARIMAVQPGEGSFHHVPMQQRQLGRQVTPFVDATWREAAQAIVLRGNHAKFAQNPDLRLALLATGTKILVEGSSKDRIWGVGIAWNDPAIENQANWKGTNWLGQILMQVRDALRATPPWSTQSPTTQEQSPSRATAKPGSRKGEGALPPHAVNGKQALLS